MIDPTLRTAVLAALEGVLNRALALDPGSRRRLVELDGHRFALHFQGPTLTVVLAVHGERLLLGGHDDGSQTTALHGSWREFVAVARAPDPAAQLINSHIRVSGDTRPLLRLRDILADLDIDWERPLARLLGDVAAHQLGRGLRDSGQLALRTLTQLRRQFGEFIREESQWLPHPVEVEQFQRDNRQLAARSERLSAHLTRLEQRVARLRGQR